MTGTILLVAGVKSSRDFYDAKEIALGFLIFSTALGNRIPYHTD
jgi:hypothetical protein